MNTDFSMDENGTPELWEHIQQLDIYDSHEHLDCNREIYRARKQCILDEILCSYVQHDLISAGMNRQDLHIATSDCGLQEKWQRIAPNWERMRATGYGQMAQIGCKEILGIEFTAGTLQSLNDRYLELLQDDFFEETLQRKSKIKLALIDRYIPLVENSTPLNALDKEERIEPFFNCVYRMDLFIMPRDWRDIFYVESVFDISINSLDNWCTACELALKSAKKKGAVAVKTALAYNRSLNYPLVARADAEREFQEILRTKKDVNWERLSFSVGESFQNYMMHELLHLLEEISLPIQFHTGLQAGNGNNLSNSNPLFLSELFTLYPDVKFILLHMSFPFQQEAAALVKMFPNVYMDLSWVHIISPDAAVRGMKEYIHVIPKNKITAFGGDLNSILCIHGHQKMARRNVYLALSQKITDRDLCLEEAKDIADRWFTSNVQEIYSL